MIIPEDGGLPPITRKGFAAANNLMLIKVPEKLRKPGDTCYQLATIDRSKEGERLPADEYVDILMKTPISKKSNENVKKTSSPVHKRVPYKRSFKRKNVFRPKRIKSHPKNFTCFPRRNQMQKPRPASYSTAPYNDVLDSHNNRPPLPKFPYSPQINLPPHSKAPNNPQINRPPLLKSPFYFCDGFNPHIKEPPPSKSIFSKFQAVAPYPNGFAPNPNVQWDRNNATNHPIGTHNEIHRNYKELAYEETWVVRAFSTNLPNRQEFLNDNFSMPPYPHSVKPAMNTSFNNPRDDYPPPINFGDNNHQQFCKQPYPYRYENYNNTQNEQCAQNGDYNNAHNVRKNFSGGNRNYNYSHQQNAHYHKNQGNERMPHREIRGPNFYQGNNNRRGRNYQRKGFQDFHGNEEKPSKFRNDGPQ